MSALRIVDPIDMHCHFGPDSVGGPPRPSDHGVSGVEAALEAQASGHKAIVLKSHCFASPALAAQIEEMVPGLRVFGGICTDYPSGGLNIDAIDVALRLGAKIVWLPAIHSHQDYLNGEAEMLGIRGGGLKVIDEELAGPRLTAEQCRELADLGATIELTALTCDHAMGCKGKSLAEMVAMANGPWRTPSAEWYKHNLLDADQVAEEVIAGIADNRLHIFPHRAGRQEVIDRHARLMEDFDRAERSSPPMTIAAE